jgi:membrane protease YdiL (CAAX protease family)
MKKAFVVLAVYGIADNAHAILSRFAFYFQLYRHYPYWVPESIKSLAGVLLCAIAARALYGPGDHFAIGRGALRGIAFGFACATPMLIGFALTRRFAPPRFLDVLFLAILFPFVEEIISRGFAFRMLWRHERWPMWAAIVVVALVTGAGHVEKSQTPLEVLGLFLLTGSGGAVFSWLLARWNSLWFPFALHMFMNGWWELFRVSRIAIGGWFPFALQSATILLAIGITLRLTSAPASFSPRERGVGGRGADKGSPLRNFLALRNA